MTCDHSLLLALCHHLPETGAHRSEVAFIFLFISFSAPPPHEGSSPCPPNCPVSLLPSPSACGHQTVFPQQGLGHAGTRALHFKLGNIVIFPESTENNMTAVALSPQPAPLPSFLASTTRSWRIKFHRRCWTFIISLYFHKQTRYCFMAFNFPSVA